VLDPATGAVRTRRLAGAPAAATVDERVRGRRHRYVFGSVDHGGRGAALVRHDLTAGVSWHTALGPGWRAGRPVFVPDPHGAGDDAGWLLALVWHAGRRLRELRVFEPRDPTGRCLAAVRLVDGMAVDRRTAWVPAGDLR
jgi:carotenoid cleavage dioxygenase-like enzyme